VNQVSERRDYGHLVSRLREAARRPETGLEQIGEFEAESAAYPLYVALIGEPGAGKTSVMIDAGIHGDEPAGVEAALRFIEGAPGNADLLSRFSLTVFPCNNPTGWECDTRENWRGIDLNRQFATRNPEPEVRIISEALQGRCFNLVFEMHEDVDSPGFYLYEIAENSDDRVAEEIVEGVRELGHPVNTDSLIEGRPANGGIIRAGIKLSRFRKTRLPLAIYAYRTCGGHVLTLEPPASVLPFEDRVAIELMGLRIALDRAC